MKITNMSLFIAFNAMMVFTTFISTDAFASSGTEGGGRVGGNDLLLKEKIFEKSIHLRRQSSSNDDSTSSSSSSSSSIDLSKYSIKYHSCSSLSSFDFDSFGVDTSGSKDTYPYTSTQVVTYRLCPSSSCSDDSWSGCQSSYGSYAITLEEYFQAKNDYESELNSVYQERCSYCENCQTFYKKYGEKCTNYSACSSYKSSYCKRRFLKQQQKKNNGKQQQKGEINMSKLVDCTKVDLKNSNKWDKYEDDNSYANMKSWERAGRVYLKIYCDGYLKIGVFKDSKCSKYIGDEVTIQKATNLNIKEDSLKSEFQSNKCQTCKVDNIMSSSSSSSGYTLKSCKSLYSKSAKCNKKISSNYDSTTCSVIEDIQSGNVNSHGLISNKYLSYTTSSPTKSSYYRSSSSYQMSSNKYTLQRAKSSAYGSQVEGSSGGSEEVSTYGNSSDVGDDDTNKVYYYVGDDDNDGDYENDDYDGDDGLYYYYTTSNTTTSTTNKTFKEYQTDFTDTINDKYLPEGVSLSENQLMYIIGGLLLVVSVIVGYIVSSFLSRRVNGGKDGNEYINSDLIRNEGGVVA